MLQVLVLGLTIVALCNGDYDYYWKDYTGKVPTDAFEAGKDVNQENVYIGLVYLQDTGIVPATIHSGQKVDEILSVGDSDEPEKAHNYVQILCTKNPDQLEWIPANKTHYHFATMDRHVVRGGVQTDNWLSIGKVYYQNEAIIGKILAGRATIMDAFMQYVHNKDTKTAYSYEVLSVNKNSGSYKNVELIEVQ